MSSQESYDGLFEVNCFGQLFFEIYFKLLTANRPKTSIKIHPNPNSRSRSVFLMFLMTVVSGEHDHNM